MSIEGGGLYGDTYFVVETAYTVVRMYRQRSGHTTEMVCVCLSMMR
jgi:hypothetical protein